MEINQIRYFLAVCAEESFSRAALRCGVARPTVTIGIKALERDLRGQLFYRNSHGAALTLLGEAILPHLTRALQAIRLARLWRRDVAGSDLVSASRDPSHSVHAGLI